MAYSVKQVFYGDTSPPNGAANDGDVWINSTTGVMQTQQAGVFRTTKGSGSVPIRALTPATITTVGVATYTAAQMQGGLILRDPNGAGRSDVTPTAALLIAAIAAAQTSDSFDCWIINNADANEVITVTAGDSVTLVPATITIAQNENAILRVVVTSGTTVTIYALVAGG